MKSYNEMANDVFARRDEYETAQRRKRKTIRQATASLCCVGLTALVGIGLWQSGVLTSVSPGTTGTDKGTEYDGIWWRPDTSESSGNENSMPSATSTPEGDAANKIIIHPIDGISADRMMINLAGDDFVPMNRTEINDYYGTDIFPTVPDDLKEWEDQRYGIYKRDGGTGEVYWDGLVLNYSNEDHTRSVNIELEKGSLPITCYALFESITEKSVINNTEVGLAQSDAGYYYAEFMYRDVGFRIIAEGLSQDELVDVISSLIG